MLDALRIITAILLIFFLPGIMLVQALFPRKGELDVDFDWLYRAAIAIGLSIVITILVGFSLNGLGINPDTGMGYVTTGPITLLLICLTLTFFGIAWLRGGLPYLGKLHPKLIRFPARDSRDEDIPHLIDRQQRFKHQKLVTQKFHVIKQIEKAERQVEVHSGEQREYYSQRRKKLLTELSELEAKISKIEKGLPEEPDDVEVKIDYMEVDSVD